MIIPFEYRVSLYEDPTPHEAWAALNGMDKDEFSYLMN